MSVYTNLTHKDIQTLLLAFDIGELQSFSGILAGVENSNFFIYTKKNNITYQWVLTLFEYLPMESLSFFIHWLAELKSDGLPVAAPVLNKNNLALQSLKNKACVISPYISGKVMTTILPIHCSQLGEILARVHQQGLKSSCYQANQRGMPWLDEQVKRLSTLLTKKEASFMQQVWEEINYQLSKYPNALKGLIHGDLFHDNVLFVGNQLNGVIDFYNAGYDILLYDLAVAVNDWCLLEDFTIDTLRLNAMMESYQAIRPFNQDEQSIWPYLLQLAAFRFWISRIITFVHPDQAVQATLSSNTQRIFKDPSYFKHMLLHHLNNKPPSLV